MLYSYTGHYTMQSESGTEPASLTHLKADVLHATWRKTGRVCGSLARRMFAVVRSAAVTRNFVVRRVEERIGGERLIPMRRLCVCLRIDVVIPGYFWSVQSSRHSCSRQTDTG